MRLPCFSPAPAMLAGRVSSADTITPEQLAVQLHTHEVTPP